MTPCLRQMKRSLSIFPILSMRIFFKRAPQAPSQIQMIPCLPKTSQSAGAYWMTQGLALAGNWFLEELRRAAPSQTATATIPFPISAPATTQSHLPAQRSFSPTNYSFNNVTVDRIGNFVGTQTVVSITGRVTDSNDIGLGSVTLGLSKNGTPVGTRSTDNSATTVSATSRPARIMW